MGLLDQFGALSPDQNQGLLAAAAQMLQASGPSRMPTSFGQVLGQGLQGYQTGLSAAQEAAQKKALMEQAAALNGYKLRDAESDFNNQEALRNRAKEVAAASTKYWGRGEGGAGAGDQPMPTFQGGQSADATMRSLVAGTGPQQAAPSTQPAQPPQGTGRISVYQQHMDYADHLRKLGYGPEADAQEDRALKFMPKVKSWEKVNVGNRILLKPYFEDGTSGEAVTADVAEKLEFKSTGGKTLGLNPFTGAQVASYNNTVDPNTAYTGNITMRGQNMADTRAREALTQGKIPAGYRATAGGGLEAIPGGPAAEKVSGQQQKMADARDVLDLLKQAEPLVKKSTGSYGGTAYDAGARFFGHSTDGAEAAAQLSALEGMLVSKMPKMSGPQSDKDVAMYKQMAGKIGDPTLPADSKIAAMNTIREINQRYIDSSAGKQKPASADVNSIPVAAKSMLKMKPGLRAEFDAKYGAGAADAVLGK